MRPAHLITAGILAAVFAIPVSGQTTPPASGTAKPAAAAAAKPVAPADSAALASARIAFVNTEAFGDEKAGISRYVAALKSVEREFQPRQEGLLAMQARITSINNEVTKLNADRATAATIQSKMDESQRLQIELKRQSEDAQAAFTKRTDEVMNPIMQDIGRSLEQFATQRNITLLLDISKMAPAILSLNPASDLTAAFIAEYNKKNPAPPAP